MLLHFTCYSFMDAGRTQERQRPLLPMVISMSPGSWSSVPTRWHEEGHENPAHTVGCVTEEKS